MDKIQADLEMDRTKKLIENAFKQIHNLSSLRVDILESKHNSEGQLMKVQADIASHASTHEAIFGMMARQNERIDDVTMKFNSKVALEDFKQLDDRTKTLESVDHLARAKNLFYPVMNRQKEKQEEILEKMDEIQDCLQSLDESLSIKANKSQFHIFEEEM